MPKRSRKKSLADVNQIARSIVDQATASKPKQKRSAARVA
jgi:hypothetical protein